LNEVHNVNEDEARERFDAITRRMNQARHEYTRQRLDAELSSGRADDLCAPRLLGHAVVRYLNVTEMMVGEP
jgi:hypothetical protein